MNKSSKRSGISIELFDGNQKTADTIATQHLAIRQKQRAVGENEFRTDILDSQYDLKNMNEFYVEPGGNFWIAKDLNTRTIAGFVGLKKEKANTGKLKRMAVMPEFRGKQIGLKLAQALVDWARKEDFQIIYLSTGKDERARELVYEPLGFVVVGFDDIHEDHLMELKLD